MNILTCRVGLDLQGRNHFRLASGSFEEATTKNTEPDSGTKGTRPDKDGDGDGGVTKQH